LLLVCTCVDTLTHLQYHVQQRLPYRFDSSSFSPSLKNTILLFSCSLRGILYEQLQARSPCHNQYSKVHPSFYYNIPYELLIRQLFHIHNHNRKHEHKRFPLLPLLPLYLHIFFSTCCTDIVCDNLFIIIRTIFIL
jgi:hypothetical protein